jgi:2-phospho-L-lactate guanylyltransferase
MIYRISGGFDMFVYAIVAVKGLGTSKKRLSPVLSSHERCQLTLSMLEDVLIALKTSTVDATVVVSNDSTLCDLAKKFNAAYLIQKSSGLNFAVEEATKWCMQNRANAVLILPADIPMLSSVDVNKIIELGTCEEQIVVLSSSYDGGTNALFQSPPNLIPACFGLRSFSRHLKEAYRRGVRVMLYYSPGVAMDIDSAKDLSELQRTQSNTASRRILDHFRIDFSASSC